MTDWSFKSFRLEILVKGLVYTITSDVCSLLFMNCDLCHIKFILENKIGKKSGGLVAMPLLSADFCKLTIREHGLSN